MHFNSIHHIAIICSDYVVSKKFYCEILKLQIIQENYREERQSWKCDLIVNATTNLELFTFPNAQARVSKPEACGLRHLAFAIKHLEDTIQYLRINNILCEPIRVDEITGKKFTFFCDPDFLPIEIYEI